MRWSLILLLPFCVNAQTESLSHMRQRARIEGWTFTVSAQPPHATGLDKKDGVEGAPTPKFPKVDLPNTYVLPKLSPVENQGSCGSCWAFSLTATLRDTWLNNWKDPGRLSQQYLVDCNKNGYGCQGGYFDAADSLVKPQGAPAWEAYPYVAYDQSCQDAKPVSSIASWHMLKPTTYEIEYVLSQYHRPVSITVAAGAGPWSSYSGGVYNACSWGGTDHMITIVGYDNEGEKIGKDGSLPAGKGIWTVRNSWGTSWGEQGFMRTKMTDSNGNLCNSVAEQAAYFDLQDHK